MSPERDNVAHVLQCMRPGAASLDGHLEQLVQHPPMHGLFQPNAAWAPTMITTARNLQYCFCLSTSANGVHGCSCQPITHVFCWGAHWSLIKEPRTNVKRVVTVLHKLIHVVISPGTMLQCMLLKYNAGL